jgi:cardiolipin-specific phospholipase
MDFFRRMRQNLIPTSESLLQIAQRNLLEHDLGGDVSVAYKTSQVGLNYVVLTKKGIDAQAPSSGGENKVKTLVLMHGYGSGLAFFYKNYRSLLAPVSAYDRVVAVDWGGMGGSKRSIENESKVNISSLAYAAFTGNRDLVDQVSVPRSINYFVSTLNQTLREVGVENTPYHLAGHSLGGYLVTEYARKHHKNVEALILISPAGISRVPEAAKRDQQKVPQQFGMGVRAVKAFWELNGTPQQLIRHGGEWGKGWITNSLNRRFGKRWGDEELKKISEYLYHISALPASGEYALNSLLQPVAWFGPPTEESNGSIDKGTPPRRAAARFGVFARSPLEDTMHDHPHAMSSKPMLILYGDNDWLRFDTVDSVVEKWRGHGVDVTIETIPQAGHHLYLDNATDFHASIDRWNKAHSSGERRRGSE